MNFDETVQYLYAQLPVFQKSGGKAFKPGLDNIKNWCSYLGNPQTNLRFVHVAGTNGKGSTCHMLASTLQEVGYTTGLYTSPHLHCLTERIRVNGEKAAKDFVIQFVDRHRAKVEKEKPSFFEITLAMALEYFSVRNCDYVILETGMGGRLDATNVVTPLLSIITNIGFDHMQYLGDTLPKIAAEKAGIIKENIPVLIGEDQKETRPVFLQKAQQLNSPIYFSGDLIVDELGLEDDFFKKNIRTVRAALSILQGLGLNLNEEHIVSGIKNVGKNTGLRGRWDILSRNPTIICDVGHNEDGIQTMIKKLKDLSYDKLFFIWGMVKDKDHDKVLSYLPKKAYYYFTEPSIERKFEAGSLKEKAEKHHLKGEVQLNVMGAFRAVKEKAGPNDLIIIGGSTFIIADLDESLWEEIN